MPNEKKNGNSAEEPKRKRSEAVKKLVKQVEEKLAKDLPKATLSDYIRLLQLEKELTEDETKEIQVTWVDPGQTKPDSED